MDNLIIFSDIQLKSSNRGGTPSGLLFEILRGIQASNEITLRRIVISPSLFSRLYIPVNYLGPIINCWLEWLFQSSSNHRFKIILYPSRLRVLSLFLPGKKICIGPDDTSSVLDSLSLLGGPCERMTRVLEKYLSDLIEKITPSTVAALVGERDLATYLSRNPRHTALVIPHPLFSRDLLEDGLMQENMANTINSNTYRFIIYGASVDCPATKLQLDKLCEFVGSKGLNEKLVEINIYGRANRWIYDYLCSCCRLQDINYKDDFESFSELLSLRSVFVCLSPYPFGTKTRVLTALANGIPCLCNHSDIPYQLRCIPSLLNHIIHFDESDIESRISSFFSIDSRLLLASRIRSHDYVKEIIDFIVMA